MNGGVSSDFAGSGGKRFGDFVDLKGLPKQASLVTMLVEPVQLRQDLFKLRD